MSGRYLTRSQCQEIVWEVFGICLVSEMSPDCVWISTEFSEAVGVVVFSQCPQDIMIVSAKCTEGIWMT